MTNETAELLYAIEAALPFVKAAVGDSLCSSSGGPVALAALLVKHNWEQNRFDMQIAMAVADARDRKVCRICNLDDNPHPGNPFVFNFGKEYAHEQCLNSGRGA